MKRIVVDMMGGDMSPLETVKGVCMAAGELDAELILVGNEPELLQIAEDNELSLEGFRIVHTDDVITMEDDPLSVTRSKSGSSMSVGLRLLAEGKGDAFVSTGNTGALFTGANLIVRKMKGARRPAIGAVLPMQPPVLLIDSGANISVTSEYYSQFAVMGSVYMNKMMGVEAPRVGLLNNGAEAHKGIDVVREAYEALSQNPLINFVGNVEGNRVMENVCDVLVCDGFAGNQVLKVSEGMATRLITDMVRYAKKNSSNEIMQLVGHLMGVYDFSSLGGGIILGCKKPVIKTRGSSGAEAVANTAAMLMNMAANKAVFDKEKNNI